MFRVNWVAAELRSPSGVPLLSPHDVARLGHAARIVDVRRAEEIVGPDGHVPGSDYVPLDRAVELLSHRAVDEPLVLVSRTEERASRIALELESRGHRFVAVLMGGIVGWRQVGLAVSRDPSILSREGAIGPARTSAFVAEHRVLARDDVAAHLGDPSVIRWMKLASLLLTGRISCVDGRDGSGIIGAPGGDAGELLLVLAAFERVGKIQLDDAALRALLLRRLDAFGRLYLHTDIGAQNRLIGSFRSDRRLDAALANVFETLQWRRFLASPPEELRDLLLDHMIRPEHLGCGHLRLSLVNARDYGVRPELVESFLRQFFRLRWESITEHDVEVLPGGHAEGAVVNVLIPGDAEAYSRVPLVSPMAGGTQIFLQHPQVAQYLRRQTVHFLCASSEVDPRALEAEVTALAERQLGRTLHELARGLPIFVATVSPNSVHVDLHGEVA